MNFNKIIKSAGKVFKTTKGTIVKHLPQIMAVAGAGCFIAATVCAVKETPKAMEKLEEKKAIDPDMTTLQKAAVIVPEYKKTIGMTLLGTGFTAGAWHLVNGRMTALSTMLAAAVKDKETLIEASKEVVGEEKTGEVLAKQEEIKEADAKMGPVSGLTPDDIPYPFLFPNGTKIWMTWRDFKMHNEEAAELAAQNKGLKLSDYFTEFGLDLEQQTEYMTENGWQPDAGQFALCENTKDWYQWGYEVADYSSEPYEEDNYRHISGWKITWKNKPEPWDYSKTYY